MIVRIHGSVQQVYTLESFIVHGEDVSPYLHYHSQKVPPISKHQLQTESLQHLSFPLSQVHTL
jgi:hypothetical protein